MEHDEQCEKPWLRMKLAMDYEMRSEEWFKLEVDHNIYLCFCRLRESYGMRYQLSVEAKERHIREAVDRLNYYRGRTKPSVLWGGAGKRTWITVGSDNVIAVDFRKRRRL